MCLSIEDAILNVFFGDIVPVYCQAEREESKSQHSSDCVLVPFFNLLQSRIIDFVFSFLLILA